MDGVRVVEAAGYLLVPTAGAVLADWGADVIKVEHPVSGDPYRGLRNDFVRPGLPNPMLELPNRGKRSVGIDIANTAGREVLLELLRSADVFLTSLMMPTLRRLRLDWDHVRDVNPRLVYGRASGFGRNGADADRPGFDLAATWARAGLLHRLTPPGADEPVPQPGSVGDLSGGLNLAGGIAAALLRRERTGEGLEVDVSLYQTGMWIMAQSIGAADLGLAPETVGESRRSPRNPLVNSYRTRDGRWLVLCMLQADRFWADFCARVGMPELIDDPRFCDIDVRGQRSAELVSILDSRFAELSLDEWRDRFAELDGVWAPALSASEIVADPQVAANGYFPEVTAADGSAFRSVASPVQFGGRTIGELHAMPEHAQHTEEVLLELGLDWEELGRLKDARAIS